MSFGQNYNTKNVCPKYQLEMKTNLKIFKITGGWLSGFTQADGSFTIAFDKRESGLGLRPKPIFVLTQDISEMDLLKKIQFDLKIGYITTNKNNVSFYVTNLSHISKVLFPIFDKHPLKYGKLSSYFLFNKIVKMILKKQHLKLEGLIAIIEDSFSLNVLTTRRKADSKLNLGLIDQDKHGLLPETTKSSDTNTDTDTDMEREKITFNQKKENFLTLDFITGLIDGDGSFNISFNYKPYRRVRVNFTVIQETSCKQVLNELKTYFACGNVYDLASAASRYQVENVDLILDKIAPILNKVIFNTKKGEYYYTIIKVSELIRSKGYKSDDNFLKIIELSYDKNKLGKRRLLTKEDFIAKSLAK